MGKANKRLLILTLGTGPMLENGEAGYRSTQYVLDGEQYKKDGIETKTNFVAEPIMSKYVPDEIFILGTVKSVWHQFFASTITPDNDDKSYMNNPDYKELVQIEKENGINTSSFDLDVLSKRITEIFGHIKSWEKYSLLYKDNSPGIHILLTKYGINETELKENYSILKSIEKYLNEENSYEVAFDITHSFRSLPLYNLIIFNYIKSITRYDINISHVYYGNIDASHELDKKAPVVDLADLIDVLNLTNGVSEFKNTGNSVSLLNMLMDGELKKALQDFDLSTQLNAFEGIKNSLNNLCQVIRKESLNNRYTGISEMIGIVLGERFFEGKDLSSVDISSLSDMDLKFLLSKWFFNQNRTGLGLATGLEVLRDINTPTFIEVKNLPESNSEAIRVNAEAYFVQIANTISKLTQSKSDLEICVQNLGVKLRRYKEIRNIFAHSLNKLGTVSFKQIYDEINEFKENLYNLKTLYTSNKNGYLKLFNLSIPKPIMITSGNKCRVIIEFSSCSNYDKYNSSNTCKYDVYRLPANVLNELKKNKVLSEKALFLCEYIKKNLPTGYDKIYIVLHGNITAEERIIYGIFLEQLQKSDNRIYLQEIDVVSGNLSNCKKSRVLLSLDEQKNSIDDFDVIYSVLLETQLKLVEKKGQMMN